MTARQRLKHTFRLPPGLARQLADHARSRRVSQVAVVEAAVSRRLDRTNRAVERLEWQVELATEALSLFIRFWLTSNPPLPDTARAAAQAMGKERWEGFVESLNRRMEFGPRLKTEVAQDIDASRDPRGTEQ